MRYKHVIWDWNGTLLDDVKLGHQLLNALQVQKGVVLTNFTEYKKIFTFPITEFYKRAGLIDTNADFAALADEFIKQYEIDVKKCKLHKYTKRVLKKLMKNNITNSILTAGLQSMAQKQLADYGITKYFTHITGKQDYYASGKSELIDMHIKKIGFNPNKIIFIGDTLHDVEIAKQIGCNYIIVSHGHQDVSFASGGSIDVVQHLREAVKIILGKGIGYGK